MRKQYFLLMLAVTVIVITATIGCSSAPSFSEVTGKKWKLIEVNINDRNILFNREALANEDAGDIFSFDIDAQIINVTGAPNQCSGQYTLGSNQAIRLSSMNPALESPRQPEKLREQDFFVYMQNVYKWNLVNKNLELYSKTEDDAEVKLVFSL